MIVDISNNKKSFYGEKNLDKFRNKVKIRTQKYSICRRAMETENTLK